MKNSRLEFEPSLATKKLHLATRKAPRVLGKAIHPGLVHTASPHRDVALMLTAFALEAASLALLWTRLPYHPGIVAGLAAFDTAGALLMHAGVGDANLRAAEVAAATTAEEKAAITAQRPGYFIYVRALGGVFIAVPLVFKTGSLLKLPMALYILGGYAPAVMVAFVAVAVFHFFFTGYALAHLRYRRAENRERLAMLRSGKFGEERAPHENRIKAARERRFTTFVHLKEVEHTDGHSLRLESVAPDGSRRYVLTTRGRFDDSDLDFMVQGQHDLLEKTELFRHGLLQQLDIEQGEPLSSAKPSKPEALPPVAPLEIPANPTQPGPARPRAEVTRAAAALLLGTMALGVSGCGPEKAEPVKMTIVATKPVAAPGGRLPESVLALLAPPAPLARKYVPQGEIVRLDLPDAPPENLAPLATTGTAQKALEGAWQIDSAELELAKATEHLRVFIPSLAAKPAPVLNAEAVAKQMVGLVGAARSEGREVIAVTKAAKDGAVAIAPGVSVEARANAKEVATFIEEKLKAGAAPSVVVLLDPPAYAEAAPVEMRESGEVTHLEEKESVPPTPESEPRIVAVPGSSDTFIVNVLPGAGQPAKVDLRLPDGARAVGEPVLFDNNSAKLTKRAWEVVEGIAAELKRTGCRRVILVASADPVGKERENADLAERRGRAVEAALVTYGIVVQSLLSVGESLAPDDTPSGGRQQFREVRAYTTETVATVRL